MIDSIMNLTPNCIIQKQCKQYEHTILAFTQSAVLLLANLGNLRFFLWYNHKISLVSAKKCNGLLTHSLTGRKTFSKLTGDFYWGWQKEDNGRKHNCS